MTSLVAALRDELAQLEGELMKDARYRKAMQIRELLAAYSEDGGKKANEPNAPSQAVDNGGSSKKALVKREIDRLLRAEGPTHRRRILEVLIAKKLMGEEKNPMQSLAIYLTGFSDDFESHGDGIWAIK